MENIERREKVEVEEKINFWIEIPELEAGRKFYFPKIVNQPEALWDNSIVECQISPEKTEKCLLKNISNIWELDPEIGIECSI